MQRTTKKINKRDRSPEPVSDETKTPTLRQPNKACSCEEITSSLNQFKAEFKNMMYEWQQDQRKQLTDLQSSMTNIKLQIESLRSTTSEVEKSLEFLCGENEDMKKKLSSLELLASTQETRIKSLEGTVEEQSRQSVVNMLEMRNVPWTPKETKSELMKTTLHIIQLIAPHTSETDILETRRLPSKTEKKTILVCLASGSLKSNIILASRKYNAQNKGNPLSTLVTAPNSPREPIYIDEHLTAKGKRLYYLARQLKKKGLFQFCWTAHGKVLLRDKEGGKTIHVTEEDQINDLSGTKDLTNMNQ